MLVPYMKDPIHVCLKKFLEANCAPQKPILIGFSGGPDSLALLHLLLECSKEFPCEIHVAHVDHGWREESAKEAEDLKIQIEALGLPFYHKRLQNKPQKNLEEEGRKERLAFFESLTLEKKFQALVLGHHRDDQAETVLKRIFEAAFISNVRGLQPISTLNGMQIWRPLLPFSKKELIDWLTQNKLIPLNDSSNEDLKFLRARLRTQIMPYLEDHFGKEIKKTLSRIGDQAAELSVYLNKKIAPWLKGVEEGPFGFYIDFLPFPCIEKLEFIYLLKTLAQQENILLSHHVLEILWTNIFARESNKKTIVKDIQIICDRGILFWIKQTPCFLFDVPVETNTFKEKNWKWSISCTAFNRGSKCTQGWRDAWKGEVIAALPAKFLRAAPYKTSAQLKKGDLLRNWWTEKKVPAFMRSFFPLIWDGNEVLHEFLTNSPQTQTSETFKMVKIQIEKNFH